MAAALFVFEGADGVGKSRRCRDTSKYIAKLGLPCDVFSFPGKKLGSLGQVVHTLHNSPHKLGVPSVRPAALQTLHIAAQLDAIERDILPALAKGRTVLLDRFWWSTWVYGSKAGVDDGLLTSLVALEQRVWGKVLPTAVFFIDRSKPIRQEHSARTFERLRLLYQQLAAREKRRYPVFTIHNDEFDVAQAKIEQIVKSAFSAPLN